MGDDTTTGQLVSAAERVRAARERIEALVARAAQLRGRLELDGELPLGQTLDRLAEQARRAAAPAQPEPSRDDGSFLGDAWDIALASEEGK